LFFELTTRWRIPAPREAVFAAIAEPADWPGWWPGVVSTREDDPGDENGIGRRGEIVWRAPFGYKVRFEMTAQRIEPPSLLEASAVGDLTGAGTWRFTESGDATHVEFAWRVDADKPLMRAAAPLVRRILVWNHDRLMRVGEEALTKHLAAPPLHTDI
jgi:uncharacterized protein YndB with AHSA1/START domain